MKVLTIVGARPQFVKAATVSRAIAASEAVNEVVVHTGQHYDRNMSEIFFEELEIAKPQYNLGIGGSSHGKMTGEMLAAIEATLVREEPDWVLVYGDTNSTLAGALAAVKLQIPVAHVEAGLRSFNRRMPEEINRVVADHVSTLLYTPTDTATANLIAEGLDRTMVHQVGDVMFDAALFYGDKAVRASNILTRLELEDGGFVLATVHRQENTESQTRFAAIVKAMNDVAVDVPVVWPMHPRTRRLLDEIKGNKLHANLLAIEPVGYLDMVVLERAAAAVATDSGGVQKEAFFHGTPCVTLRDETEWVELIDLGWNRLAPPGCHDISAAIRTAITEPGREGHPYGDGSASAKIVVRLIECSG